MNSVLELIDTNLSGQTFSVFNLSPIKVPGGGGREFRVDGAGGSESMRAVEGVIVAYRQVRAYWRDMFGSGGGKKPPDCSSTNGLLGIGDPGGDCPTCPYSQFGSSINANGSAGRGQACKDMRQLLIVLPDELLPHVFNLPPTSIRNFLQYSLHLVSAGAPYWSVITKLTLEPTKSGGGIEYSQVRFQMLRRLDPNQLQRLEPYHKRMAKLLAPAAVESNVYEVEAEAAPTEYAEEEPPAEAQYRTYSASDFPTPQEPTEDEEIPF